MDFIIDTEGDEHLANKSQLIDDEFEHVEEEELADLITSLNLFADKIIQDERKQSTCEDKNEHLIRDFYAEMGWGDNIGQQSFRSKIKSSKNKFQFPEIAQLQSDTSKVDRLMKKSVLQPGFEKQISLPEYNVSDKRLKAIRKKEREKTKGPKWFNMAAPEITDELKNDLDILRMRSALDPKHFYKKNDMEALPKYFQVGKVVDSPLDHLNVRLTKKERKKTLVDELLADAEFNKYNKKKYKQIIEEKRKTTYRTYIKDKRKKNKDIFKKKKKEDKRKKTKSKS